MPRRDSRKRARTSDRLPHRPRPVEPLERRVLLASDLLSGMAQELLDHVQQLRDDVGATFGDPTELLAQVPLIGPQAAEAAAFLDDLGEDLQSQIDALPDDAGAQDLEDLLNSFDAISNAQVTLSADTVGVTMDLGRTVELGALDLSFDVGLRSLPFYIHSSGGLVGELSFSYSGLGFTYHDPGNGEEPTFTPDTAGDDLSISVSAGLSDDAAIEATVGFLHGSITDAAEPGLDSGVLGTLSLDVLPGGVALTGITGSATVALDLVVDVGNNFPDLGATFVLDWADLQEQPEARFQDVHISLDGAVARILGPLVNAMEPVLNAIEPITDVLTEPLPVLDQLGIDVNLIGLAEGVMKLAGDSIPPNYQSYIEAIITVVEVIDFIEMFESDGGGSGFDINFGGFDITGEGESDLRFVDAKNAITSDELSSLVLGGGVTFDLAQLQQAITDNLPAQIAGPLNDVIDRFSSGVDFSVPLMTDPTAAVFPLLLGRETQLMSLSVDYESPPPEETDFSFDTIFPFGIDGGFDVSVNAGIHVELGLDTFGLRSFIASDFQEPARLLDGFYIADGSTMFLGGVLSAYVSAGVPFFGVSLEGGIEADFAIEARRPENPADEVDNNPDTVRLYSELMDCLLHASGSAKAFLDLVVKIGVDLPVLGFIGYSKEFTLAEKTLFDISGCLIDPFNPPDVFLAEYDDQNGVLLLNMGSQARRDARNFEVDHVDEIFQVFPDGDGVAVSAFGTTQHYPMPALIIADGGSGKDTVRIEGLDVEAQFTGGSGDDRLEYLGAGTVFMSGGSGNDTLLSNAATSHLAGDAGDDHLTSTMGQILNLLEGGAGNDRLVGGAGPGQLFGEEGDDTLIAGTAGDELHGGDDDDVIALGAGDDQVFGGDGSDVIEWEAGDGSPTVDAGSGVDRFAMSGTDGDDTFAMTTNDGYAIIAASGPTFPAAVASVANVQNYLIDGELGSDTASVTPVYEPPPPVTTEIFTIVINGSDLQNPDAAEDHVDVFGHANGFGDALTVETAGVTIFDLSDDNDAPVEPNSARSRMMRVSRISGYEVYTTNVADDLLVDSRDDDDEINVLSITGPTAVTGNAGDDAVTVRAHLLDDYFAELDVFDEHGTNTLLVDLRLSGGEDAVVETLVTDDRISSIVVPDAGDPETLLPGVNYTPNSVSGGLTVSGSESRDTLNVASTLPGITTRVDANGDDDDINISSVFVLPGGHLLDIRGHVRVNGGGGSNVLTLADVLATGGNQDVLVQGGAITGFAGPADDTPVTFGATGGEIRVQLWGSDAQALGETYTILSPNAPVVVEDNAGDSDTHVHRTDHPVTVSGGAGSDRVIVGGQDESLQQINAQVFISGGSGVDDAFVLDRLAPGGNYALIGALLVRDEAEIAFDDTLDTLALEATEQIDLITVFSLPVGTLLHFDQNGGDDTLLGPNTDNTWRITGNNAGLLNDQLTFVSSQTLAGNSQADTFLVTAGGSIQNVFGGGGAAMDTLDYSQFGAAATIFTATKLSGSGVVVSYEQPTPTATNVGGFVGIQRLVGAPNRRNQLIGSPGDDTFELTGVNSGSLTTPAHGLVDFISFHNLHGGDGLDIFRVHEAGVLNGGIDGGGGSNLIDYSPSTSPVLIQLHLRRASRVSGRILNVGNAVGGAGDDLLFGNDDANVLAGGPGNDVIVGLAGNDTLFGQVGRDLVIGGAGSDGILGGDGDDILIGGSTAHDASEAALAALMAEWSRPDLDYAARVDNLRNGGGLNGDTLLNAATVFDDGEMDALAGDDGLDWFWSGDEDDILDLDPQEVVN